MKAEANEHGVTWATSKSGKIDIAVKGTEVWGIYVGTHDLAPIARNFNTQAEARDYANKIWRTR